jgi:hypothetical protein
VVAHAVEFHPAANLLRIETSAELRRFTREFGTEDRYGDWTIRWPDVAARWQGILITPYQWDCRLDDEMFWYYGWDCASGCIWDAGAVASIKQVDFEPRKAEA